MGPISTNMGPVGINMGPTRMRMGPGQVLQSMPISNLVKMKMMLAWRSFKVCKDFQNAKLNFIKPRLSSTR